mmetsp:Transcript_13371/g.38036  ORF Transcript_13371/g.38036 Transcript_13371/m.38036 type:complete len:108 (+) Transcript_13371:117-440(+)
MWSLKSGESTSSAKRSSRKCGLCGLRSHNRRTCPPEGEGDGASAGGVANVRVEGESDSREKLQAELRTTDSDEESDVSDEEETRMEAAFDRLLFFGVISVGLFQSKS